MTNKIPIFIIVHDRLETIKKCVKSFETLIKTPIEIIFHDSKSTYEPTIQYLNEMENKGYTIYRSKINNHHNVVDSAKDYLEKNKECKYYVITDPDIELYQVDGDILEFYIFLLNKFKVESVGPMLKIDDIPDYYPRKQAVLNGHGKQFWNKKPKKIKYKDNDFLYINCPTDTTFQLKKRENCIKKFPHSNSIRTFHPYSAKHLDWYLNPNKLLPCEEYYIKKASDISHWGNNNWNNNNYHGIKIKKIIK
jgi:hypothetical protein